MSSGSSDQPIPVAIFTGYLGAGKTTIIQGIVPQIAAEDERVLIIVNDLSPDNTDVFAFQSPSQGSGETKGQVAALSGGCVCCNLLGGLVTKLLEAHARRTCSYVILECTGVADPAPVVATIGALPALAGKFFVDAVVAVVSAAALAAATTTRTVSAGNEASCVTLDVARSDVMGGQQVLGANVVLINKWEPLVARGAVTRETLAQWPALLREFCAEANPDTRVWLTKSGRIDFVDAVWRQRLCEADGTLTHHLRAYAAAGKTLGDFGSGEAEEAEEARELAALGLCHFTFRSADVVVSTRELRAAMVGPQARGKRLLRQVWRSKGFFAAADDECGTASPLRQFRWQSVGRSFDYGEVLPPAVRLIDGAGDAAVVLTCRIVFMGNFSVEEKAAEAEAFFASLAPC